MSSNNSNKEIILQESNSKSWNIILSPKILGLIETNLILKIADDIYCISESYYSFIAKFMLDEIESDSSKRALVIFKEFLAVHQKKPLEIQISLVNSVIVDYEKTLRKKFTGFKTYDSVMSILRQQSAVYLVNMYENPFVSIVGDNIFKTQRSYCKHVELVRLFIEHFQVLEACRNSKAFKPSYTNDLEDTRTIILDIIDAIDSKLGWEYIFKLEKDRDCFVDILTSYFVNNDYKLPQKSILCNPKIKTRFARVLNEIYFKYDKGTLRSNLEFFKLLKILSTFEGDTNEKLYKALTG